MNLSSNRLIAAAGLCAAAAGAIFIGVQINHPPVVAVLVVLSARLGRAQQGARRDAQHYKLTVTSFEIGVPPG